MKISIYELLGLIKKGIAPKKIKVTGNIYIFDEDYNFYTTQGTYDNCRAALGGKHGEINLLANAFSEIVEIIEDYEISEITKEEFERLDKRTLLELIVKNQNELIKKINIVGKGEKNV